MRRARRLARLLLVLLLLLHVQLLLRGPRLLRLLVARQLGQRRRGAEAAGRVVGAGDRVGVRAGGVGARAEVAALLEGRFGGLDREKTFLLLSCVVLDMPSKYVYLLSNAYQNLVDTGKASSKVVISTSKLNKTLEKFSYRFYLTELLAGLPLFR